MNTNRHGWLKATACFIAWMLLAPMAQAQEVTECDWRASAQALVEPWDENSRVFANGTVRVALLDTVEPAAGALHLLILSPPYSELGEAQCKVISYSENIGFAMISFDKLTAEYDPECGLLFDVPVYIYVPELSFGNSALLSITLNQATGAIDLSMELGME